MPIFRSHKEVQRAELRTVGLFAYAMFWLAIAFGSTLAVYYLLSH